SGVTGSGRLQKTAAMFFNNAATGAQRKGSRFVPAFGVQHRLEREWLRSRIARIVRQKIDQHEVAFAVRTNEQGGWCFPIQLGADLSRKVQANVQNLVGVGKHEWKGRSEIEAHRTGSR